MYWSQYFYVQGCIEFTMDSVENIHELMNNVWKCEIKVDLVTIATTAIVRNNNNSQWWPQHITSSQKFRVETIDILSFLVWEILISWVCFCKLLLIWSTTNRRFSEWISQPVSEYSSEFLRNNNRREKKKEARAYTKKKSQRKTFYILHEKIKRKQAMASCRYNNKNDNNKTAATKCEQLMM